MGKLFRWLFILFILAVGLVVVLAVVLYQEPVQRQIALAVVRPQVEGEVDAKYVHAGFGGAELRKISYRTGVDHYSIESLVAKTSPFNLTDPEYVQADSVTLNNFVADLSARPPEETDILLLPLLLLGLLEESEDPQPLVIPVVALETLRANGTVLGPEQKLDFTLRGDGFSERQAGQIDFQATLTDDRRYAEYSRVELSLTGELSQKRGRGPVGGTLQLRIAATPFGIPEPVILRLEADVDAADLNALQAKLRFLSGTSDDRPLLTVDFEANPETSAATGNYAVSLTGNDLRPLFAGIDLPNFRLTGNGVFDSRITDADLPQGSARANLRLQEFIWPSQDIALRQVDLGWQNQVSGNGQVQMVMPIRIQGVEEVSDLTLTARTTLPANATHDHASHDHHGHDHGGHDTSLPIEMRITSDQIHLADTEPVLGALAAIGDLIASFDTAAPPTQLDVLAIAPPWDGITGGIDLELQQVTTPDGYIVRDIIGHVDIEETRVVVPSLQAQLGDSPVQATGELRFVRGSAEPYRLQSKVKLESWEAGPFFAEADPSSPPLLEGTFELQGAMTAQASSLELLADRAQGQLNARGGPGTMRLLAASGLDAGSIRASVAGAGLLGALSGRSEITSLTNGLVNLASEIEEFSFTDLRANVTRGEDLNILVQELAFLSPSLKVSGAGGITYQEGVAVDAQPLSLSLNIGMKDTFANLFNRIGLLRPDADAEGYSFLTMPMNVGGSLAEPDTSDVNRLFQLAGRNLVGSLTSATLNRGQGTATPQPGTNKPAQQPAARQPVDPQNPLSAILGIVEGINQQGTADEQSTTEEEPRSDAERAAEAITPFLELLRQSQQSQGN